MLALSVVLLWHCVCNVWCAPGELGSLAPFAAARGYDVEGTVLLNEVAATDREVGYKLKASLQVAPVWSDAPHQHLLRFHLIKPKLYLRGKHKNAEFLPHGSVLDSHSDSTFYAHWNTGIIHTAYLDPNDMIDLLNFKKSLLSVFQFQILDGEYDETDISGNCSVLYETVSEKVFRKIKSKCSVESSAVGARYRRVSRYTLTDTRDALAALHAEEVVEPRAADPGLKARSWLALRLQHHHTSAQPPTYTSLEDAVQALPNNLQPMPLTMTPGPAMEFEDYASLEEAVRENRMALEGREAGAGGVAGGALAALRLVTALGAASATQLRALLLDDNNHHLLPGLCGALGLAGTRAALAAAADVLQLHSPDPMLALAHNYLEGFARAPRPHEEAVLEVLKLGEEARSEALVDSALLAAAAAARACRAAAAGDRVRQELTKSLARCKSDECRRVRLLALGNLRRADTSELLLQHAEREDAAASVRLAALDALRTSPHEALTVARLTRLGDLALDARAPLEVRAAALDLHVVRFALTPAPLVRVARELHRAGSDAPHELRRLFWQRLRALADEHQSVRDIIPLLDRPLRMWDAQAHAGTSSVLVRETGWSAGGRGGWRGVLESVQVARGGLLRRGAVRLRALHGGDALDVLRRGAVRLRALHGGDALDVLSVEVWTRGLEAVAGGGGGGGDAEPEDTAGGLALAVAGTRMRDISLFNGQAELVGHVWAGTASAPTPALRAVVPAPGERGSAPLLLGGVLEYRWRGAVSLALDAHAQVSLWWRTARCQLELRAALAALEEAALHTAWGRVTASAATEAEPRLRIAADLDFYDTIALCVRASTDLYESRSNVSLSGVQGSLQARVRRSRAVATGVAGRTLSLGALNDAACRALRSADAPDTPDTRDTSDTD